MTRSFRNFSVPAVGAKIEANTCGTAYQKTVSAIVSCEMSVKDTEALIVGLSRAVEWVKHQRRDCNNCMFGDCPEHKGTIPR
jgi:hypothetical protein